jgi:hypothetical protein
VSTTARTNRAKMTARMERRERGKAEANAVIEAEHQRRLESLKHKYSFLAAEYGITVPLEFWDWTPLEQFEWTVAYMKEHGK